MRNHLCTFILIIFAFTANSQDEAYRKLEFWQINHIRANNIYFEILDLNYQNPNDSSISYKSTEALTCINLAIAHCEGAKKLNPTYIDDANTMIIESLLVGIRLNQIEACNSIFTDKLARDYINICFELRPLESSIPYYKLHFKPENENEHQKTYYEQVFYKYLQTKEDNNIKGMEKYGSSYINHLQEIYPTNFPQILFTNDTISYERNRVFDILTSSKDSLKLDLLKLEYHILLLEYISEFYSSNKIVSSNFKLIQKEEEIIDNIDRYCLKNITNSKQEDIDYLIRIGIALIKLNKYDQAYTHYTKAICSPYSYEKDILAYISITKIIVKKSMSKTVTANKDKYISDATDVLYNRLMIKASIQDLKMIVENYEYANNLEKAKQIAYRLELAEQEEKERESKVLFKKNNGLSIGFAPAKLSHLTNYSQFSVMGDIKIKGFEQGFRYCHYDNFEDKYRFGTWFYVSDDTRSSNTYSGYDISYWVTIQETKLENIEQKIALEFRYGKYNFETIEANVLNLETEEVQFYNYNINPIARSYDLSLVFRMIYYASGIFFLESNMSLGFGYRNLGSEFNFDKFRIDDIRYKEDRWPKITAPVRFGLRIGIKII